MILTATLDSIKADEHFKEVNCGGTRSIDKTKYFSFQHRTYFAQVTAKYKLLTGLQKTESVAIKEELFDPEDTDIKSKGDKSEVFLLKKNPHLVRAPHSAVDGDLPAA